MRAGLKPAFSWAVYAMLILLIVIFIGFMNHFRAMYYGQAATETASGAKPSAWCTVPMWLSLAPLLVLGLWWPAGIWHYLSSIAGSLSPGVP
jgi:hydrogenase-4 component F